MKITERLLLKLYRLIKPWFLRLERYTLQAEQFAIALEKIKALRQRRAQGTDYRENLEIVRSPDVCEHLKGGRLRNRGSYKDYAVYLHTFVDGHKEIRCMICRKEWTQDSPDWEVALNMAKQSSNSQSSSEVSFDNNRKDLNGPDRLS